MEEADQISNPQRSICVCSLLDSLVASLQDGANVVVGDVVVGEGKARAVVVVVVVADTVAVDAVAAREC